MRLHEDACEELEDGGRVAHEDGVHDASACNMVEPCEKTGVTLEALQRSETRFRSLFENMSEGFFLAEIICDDLGKPCDYRYLEVNRAFQGLTGLTSGDVVGRTVREVLPGVEDEWIETYGRVALTGEAEKVTQYARPLGRIYETTAYCPAPGQFACLFSDVTERQEAEDALRESERLLQDIMDGSPSIVILKNREGRFIVVNKQFEALLGISRTEIRGKTDFDIFPPETAEYYRRNDALVIETQTAMLVEEEADLADGHHVFLAHKFPLRNRAGEIYGVGGISHDITGRKRMEEVAEKLACDLARSHWDLEERTARLQEINRDLESFSYSVSHDLRAPLRAIEGFSALLCEELGAEISPTARRYLDVVRENAIRMAHLIEDLLALSRTGREKMRAEIVNVSELVQNCWHEVSQGVEKPLRFKVRDLPPITGDPRMLRQLFVNLLGNAIKYAGPDEVFVEVNAAEQEGETIYCVRDRGIGFDPKYAEKIFGVFQRLHTQDKYEGTGIGLATVRRIAQRHGGRAWAESEQGKGATFYVALPGRKSRG